ncbi:RNA polymerase sigma factor [Streptomyces sp. DT24]|uniref:RNA polymerase sigma factor n=1 Tax=Streptomyces sp. DT24 TaxID=3416520 RepID=UPI003CFA3491
MVPSSGTLRGFDETGDGSGFPGVPGQRGPRRTEEDRTCGTLPPESRRQWEKVLGMRRTCLLIAYKYVPWDRTEDVWQETRISMWRTLLKGPLRDPESYTRTVCRNEGRKQLRKDVERAEQFIGDNVALLDSGTPVFDTQTDTRLKELVSQLQPELSHHEALIFVLRMGLKWDARSVAEAIDTTPGAVKSALYAAKKKMRSQDVRDRLYRRLNPE